MSLNWLGQNAGSLYFEMLILLSLALVTSSIGFYRLLYFINIGYAFAIIAMVITTIIRQFENLSFVSVLQNALLLLWGLRLGIYLVKREYQTAFQKLNNETHQGLAGVPWGARIAIWLSVSTLYVLMFAPSLFRLIAMPEKTSWLTSLSQGIGLLLMIGGLLLESVADKQKSDFKAEFPKQYCNAGLYRWVRCPNYFGEIIFWVGNWVVAIMFYTTPMKWVVSLIGAICIIWIMMISTKRLEKAQNKRYGDQVEYQQYIRSVPVLFPYIPVYSLKSIRLLLG